MFVLRNRLTLPDKSRKRASFWVVLLPFVAIAFFATTLIAQNTRAIKKKQVVKPTISGRTSANSSKMRIKVRKNDVSRFEVRTGTPSSPASFNDDTRSL